MFVPVEERHIIELSHTMQELDKESIKELAGISPLEGLLVSISNSMEVQTWDQTGQVAAIVGISKPYLLADYACPWLLCSDLIRSYPKTFLKESRKWVYEKLEEHSVLRNVVYYKHERSIRWLTWLGFTIYAAKPIGINGGLFHVNELRKS